MAISRTDISTGSLANGSAAPTLHSAETKSTVLLSKAADYFLPVYDVLKVGDFILAHCTDGDAIYCVTASTSVTVTVTSVALA